MSYFHPLNFIRFVLAIGVVLFHYGKDYYPFNSGWLNQLIVNSSFRVSFFFFISGFVMSLVYAPQAHTLKPKAFYWKRFTRIMPMFWMAFIASIFLILFVLNASPKGLVIILHALGLQSLYPGYVLDLNFTAWSISVEIVFYAVFPLLLRWMAPMPMDRMMGVATLLWLLQSAQHVYFVEALYDGTKRMEEFISTFPLWHLPTFIAGMVAARWVHEVPSPVRFRKFALPVFFLCLSVFAWIVFVSNPVLKYVHNGLLAPLFALTVLSLYYDRSILHRILAAPAVSSLGNVSYAIFIFQYPIWIVCYEIAGDEQVERARFFLAYLAILIVFAWLVNRYFERPVLRWLRRSPAGQPFHQENRRDA